MAITKRFASEEYVNNNIELARPDWNQNDESASDYIKNRTHYDTSVIILDNYSYTEDIEVVNGFGKVSDSVIPNFKDVIESKKYSYDLYTNGEFTNYELETEEYEELTPTAQAFVITLNDEGNRASAIIFNIIEDNAEMGLTKGVWIHPAGGDYHFKNFKIEGEIKHLDPKYIPDSIARKEYIDKKAGLKVEGEAFTVNGEEVTASNGAEIFNDYLGNKATGECSHAEGQGTTAAGLTSHAEGQGTKAIGSYSHAEGGGTTASGAHSHAEGGGTTASGNFSHTEGGGTVASGEYSHTEGIATTASGLCSHTEGMQTTASGNYSHTEGEGTVASGNCSHVQGKYNIKDSNNTYAHIVGNGISDTQRHNAHTLDWDGNAWYQGSVESTSVILKSPDGTRFNITVANDGSLNAVKITN